MAQRWGSLGTHFWRQHQFVTLLLSRFFSLIKVPLVDITAPFGTQCRCQSGSEQYTGGFFLSLLKQYWDKNKVLVIRESSVFVEIFIIINKKKWRHNFTRNPNTLLTRVNAMTSARLRTHFPRDRPIPHSSLHINKVKWRSSLLLEIHNNYL